MVVSEGETWEWDGAAWLHRTPPMEPPARSSYGISFDEARGLTVLFGGELEDPPVPGSMIPLDDLWEWDGGTWTRRFPAAGPSPRFRPQMTFDSLRGVTLLHSGFEVGNQWLGDRSRRTEERRRKQAPGNRPQAAQGSARTRRRGVRAGIAMHG